MGKIAISLIDVAVAACVGLVVVAVPIRAAGAIPNDKAVADAQGNLHVPANYRHTYEFVGAWAIAADAGSGSKAMHVVYASPGTVSAYQKSGHFPIGAVLIKEVFDAVSTPMTTGTAVSHAETLKGWFVMVKGENQSHPTNPLWGDGWGWSWFDANNPNVTTSKSYSEDCRGCHLPATPTDMVYLQGYPPLSR